MSEAPAVATSAPVFGLPAAAPTTQVRPAIPTTDTGAPEPPTAAPTLTSGAARPSTTAATPTIETLAVVGIRYDGVLRVRSQPGVESRTIARLTPDTLDVGFTGRTMLLASGLWYEVVVDGETGWASGSFLGRLGSTDDATDEAVALAGRPPQAASVHGLGRSIGSLFLPEGSTPRVRVTDPGSIGATGVVTVDATVEGDGPIVGYRLVVRAVRLADDTGYVLTEVQRTVICQAGEPGRSCE